MKKVFKYLVIAAAAAFAINSCATKEQDVYTPAAGASGTQYYFPKENPTEITITDNTTSVEFTVKRAETVKAEDINVSVKDPSGKIFFNNEGVVVASFAKDADGAVVSLPIDIANFEYGETISLELQILSEDISPYRTSVFKFSLVYPEPWTSLGYGTWEDAWLFGTTFEKVEFFQHDLYPNQFKIGWSAAICEKYEDEDPADWPEFFYFQIIPQGATLGGVTVTEPDLIYYNIFDTGNYVSNYDDDIYIIHPSAFTDFRSMDYYRLNKVTMYQDPVGDKAALPAVVELAPAYYLLNYGAGWASQSSVVNMKLVFPGVVLADYTIDMEYEGLFSAKDGTDNAVVNITYEGPDVTDVAVVLVEGKDPEAAKDLIDPQGEEAEQDPSVVVISAAGQVKLPFAQDAPANLYTIVAVPFNEEGYLWDYSVYETIKYGEVSPLVLEYTSDDFTAVIPKEKLLSTQWVAYAAPYDGTATDRQAVATVVFNDAEDNTAGDDLITCSGLASTSAFTDTFTLEYYNGVLYLLAGSKISTWSSYDVWAMSFGTGYGTGNYSMSAAYVADGIIAFVNNSTSQNYTGFAFWALSNGNIAGYLVARNYLLLVDPEVVSDPSSNSAIAKKLAKQGIKLKTNKTNPVPEALL